MGSHSIAETFLEHTMKPRLTSNSKSPCPSFPSAEITAVTSFL